MSGGQLVVLDRLGRDVKRYPLPEGLATLGSDPACDIRVMLSSVSAHHATVVVHANQTVVRNVGSRETLVNGRPVSVAALRHRDLIELGGRQLRWEYSEPRREPQGSGTLPDAGQGASLVVRGRRGGGRVGRRASGATPAPQRSPGLQLALEMRHRASMPANAGGKQVAIVQPQRRDTSDLNDQHHSSPRPNAQTNKRSRSSNSELDSSISSENDRSKRKSSTRPNTKSPLVSLQGTTKATLWIESRKTSPRKNVKMSPASVLVARKVVSAKKSTPLRMAVLRKAQSAQKVMKIEAPLKIDHTKQAALMLMTGHTPKKLPSPKNTKKSPKTPTYLVKKRSPVRKTPQSGRKRSSKESSVTPKSDIVTSSRSSRRTRYSEFNQTVPTTKPARSSRTQRSPLLPTPKKSALKDPSAKKSSRKTESIKFDLSNLENHNEESQDVFMVSDSTQSRFDASSSFGEEDLTLRYSDTSNVQSPSPRKSIHSRSSKILERSLGTPMVESKSSGSLQQSTLTPESPRGRMSSRGSLILQKALRPSENESRYSQRTTKSLSDDSYNTTVASAFRTKTLSPRSPNRNNLESYSIVDLVSVDSSGSIRTSSVYNSVRSKSSNSSAFGTPQSNKRKTRSTMEPVLMSSSTPYVNKVARTSNSRSQSSPNVVNSITSNDDSQLSSRSNRRSKSLTTPENTQKYISVNSTRISRASRSRSRINDTDLLLISAEDTQLEDASPKSSKQLSRANKSQLFGSANKSAKRKSTMNMSPNKTHNNTEGASTPENRNSPGEVGTPVLSIQSLLNSSQSSLASQRSQKSHTRGRPSLVKRKTIGVIRSGSRKGRTAAQSKSLNFGSRRSLIRLSKDSFTTSDKTDEGAPIPDIEDVVTPKSAVKLVQEAVKNKHSTAKKPQSKRSIIDDLNESDIVKQLFNSPVKRKLSQSMSEFSRKQLLDDDDDIIISKRPTRNTIAVAGRTPDNSLLEQTESYSPEVFVSPLATPSNSPDLAGIKRLFAKRTPDDDLRNVSGVKKLMRTPRTRKSVKNDLTQVSGVKKVFARSPKNRLSNVRVKEIFAALPKDDLTRVSGVKSLFQPQRKNKSPRNDLTDVRGVKNLYKKQSPANDLRNVSGVKRTLQRNSPRNDLTDVRGVRGIFRQTRQKRDDLNDVSGVEELFNVSSNSHRDTENLFDQLVGKPPIKAVYSKTFVNTKKKTPKSKAKSLHVSMDVITNNVEEWLEKELQKRLQKEKSAASNAKSNAKANLTRELQKLATDTVEGSTPFRQSRIRNSTILSTTVVSVRKKSASDLYSAHTLPIKKRSFTNASLERINNESRSNILPIKKRVVVHSTPVKGRSNLTMNASELGRVSPIAAVEKTTQGDAEVNTSIQEAPTVEIISPKGRRITRLKVIENKKSNAKAKLSPAKTLTSKSKLESPPVRSTRGHKSKTENSQLANTKKRRVSLVITKKAPILSPKPATRRGKVQEEATQELVNEIPTKRSTRRQKEVDVNTTKTPKKTRAKAQKVSVVVSKPSPLLKPRANTRGKQKEAIPKPLLQSSPKSLEPRGRARKTVVLIETTTEIAKGKQKKVESPKLATKPRESRATRGRQSKLNNSDTQPKRVRNAQNKSDSKKPEPKSKVESASAKTRGKKSVIIEVQEPKTRSRGKSDKVEEIVTEKTTSRGKNEKVERKTRGKKMELEAVELPTRKSRAANKAVGSTSTVTEDARSRKRKTTEEQEQPKKLRKTRSEDIAANKVTEKKSVENTRSGRQKKSVTERNGNKADIIAPENKSRSARSRKTEQVASVSQKEEAKPVRGRKTVAVVESATQRGGRKRKTIPETPDKSVKETNKKQPAAKRTRKTQDVTPAPAARAARGKPAASRALSTRAMQTRTAEVNKRTGRGGKR